MKVRLKDIAAATGYSVNTVSHALRDMDDISEKTKEEVRRVAKELDYIPNAQASNFKSGRNNIISIILPDIINPHFSIVFREIESYFRNVGITPFFINTNEHGDEEINAVRISIAQNVSGIIMCPSQETEKSIELLERSGIPYVLIGRHFGEKLDTNYAVCDDFGGAYLATKHFISEGHQNIACVRVNKRISSDIERFAGYCKALSDSSIELKEQNILNLSLVGRDNTKQIKDFLAANKSITAILAFNDILAYEIINVIQALGRSVPKDCSVIGFDNICAEYTFPLMLSSVSVSKKRMANIASELLYKNIKMHKEGSAEPKEHIVLPTKLYLRQTTIK